MGPFSSLVTALEEDLPNDYLLVPTEPPLVKTLQECITSLNAVWRTTDYPVVVCGTMTETKGAAKAFEACFKHEVLFEVDRLLRSSEALIILEF